MYIQKQDDGTYATTPILTGAHVSMGELGRANRCNHQWEDDGKPTQVVPGIHLQLQVCNKCKPAGVELHIASRFRLVGSVEDIERYLRESAGVRECAGTNM